MTWDRCDPAKEFGSDPCYGEGIGLGILFLYRTFLLALGGGLAVLIAGFWLRGATRWLAILSIVGVTLCTPFVVFAVLVSLGHR